MEDFPSNSLNKKTVVPKSERIKKIVTGEVTRKKRPFTKTLVDDFIAEDAKSVGSYVVQDVIIPATKNMLLDMAQKGLHRMLWGTDGGGTARSWGAEPRQRMNYTRFSSEPKREERRSLPQKTRAMHKFDDIILEDRGEAESVIDLMNELLADYENVSVGDLYEALGYNSDPQSEKWGWTSLQGAGVKRVSSGYILILPKPVAL